MNRRYPKWLVLDISDFMEIAKPISLQISNHFRTNYQSREQVINEASKQLLFLISHLLEEQFLVNVNNYNQSYQKPHQLTAQLQKQYPEFEVLFRQCFPNFRMLDLPDEVAVVISGKALIITCLKK